MQFEVEVDKHSTYFRIIVRGDAGFDRLTALVDVLGVESQSWPVRRAMLDFRGIESALTPEQQQRIGVEFASSWQHMEKVAVLVPAGQLTGISTRAARRDGLNAQSFEDPGPASDWLKL